MPTTDEILLSTRFELWPEVVVDTIFTKTALLARLRENMQTWSGGAYMSNIFRHTPMIAGSYIPGQNFTIIKRKTTDEQNFDPKFYNCQIPELWEELEVYNTRGPLQLYSLLDEDLSNGLDTIETTLGIESYGGGTTDLSQLNGLDEICGHATLPSWNGVIASSYGKQSRTTYPNLNAKVIWLGAPDGTKAPISFRKINGCYVAARKGAEAVDTILMNKSLCASVEDKMQAQQILLDFAIDPFWGGEGFRIKKAMVVIDEYCPSLVDGQTLVQTGGLGNYLTGTITGPSSATPPGGFPGSSATLYVGEVMFGLNMNYIRLRTHDSPAFQFGLTNFMRLPDNHKLNAEINVALNIQCYAGSQYQFQAYGLSA